MTHGDELRTYRRAKGKNQIEFAEMLFIRQDQLSHYESDIRAIPSDLLDDLIDAGVLSAPSEALKKDLKAIIDNLNPYKFKQAQEYLHKLGNST